MKTRRLNQKSLATAFPKLMESTQNDLIVLFAEEGSGVVVHQNDTTWVLGSFAEFVPSLFVDYHGTVELSNG
tara:strand:- start:266 stop:481 length:216 start_codon:yes stop_codon:yes gene_type:complete